MNEILFNAPNPCPVCDEEPTFYDQLETKLISIQCTKCRLYSGYYLTDEESIMNWNLKPLEFDDI